MTYFVYILKSKSSGRYYVGQTQDLNSRLEKHNKGSVQSTKPDTPWELKYHEEFQTRKESYKREQQIKDWKSRRKIEELFNNFKTEENLSK